MEQNRDLPALPEGYALVVPTGRKPGQVQDWHAAVPDYDPQDHLSVVWSNVMRWPRRLAVGFLYLTWSYKRAGTALGIAIVIFMVVKAYTAK